MDQKVKACVIVLSSTICVAALIVFFVAIINKTRLDKYPESDQIKTVQNSYIFLKSCSKCDTWFYLSVLWRIVEYLGVILPFELNAAILYLECFSNTAKQSAIIVFSVLSIIIYLFCIYSLRKANLQPLGCTGVILLYFFLTEFGLSIVYTLFGTNAIRFSDNILFFLKSENYTRSIILAIIAMLFYTLGATQQSDNPVCITAMHSRTDTTPKIVYGIGIILLVYSFLVMSGLFLTGTITFSMDYSEYRDVVFANSYYSYMIVLFSFGCCFAFAAVNEDKIIIPIILAGLTSVMLLLTGNRGEVFFPALAVFGILKIRKIRIPKLLIMIAILGVILLVPYITHTRHSGGWWATELKYTKDFFSSVADTLTEMGIQIRLTTFILDDIQNGTRTLIYGYSYYEFLLRWAGRFFPINIIEYIPASYDFKNAYATMGFNQVAESYANFGIVGVAIFHYLLGLILGKKEHNISSVLDLAVLGACCSVFINMTRNKFSFVPTHLCYIFILYLLL